MLTLGPLQFDVPAVMGIINVTPDSFSDGGRFAGRDAALRRAEALALEGAAIIDIGGESTRPGAAVVSEQEELDRVIPVIAAVAAAVEVPLSIDTSKPVVMREAIRAGAAMINDIRALREKGALRAAAELQRPVCLMHMQGQPRTMQRQPVYGNVVQVVAEFLDERVRACIAAGLPADRIIVDPGFGFGKTPRHNIELLSNLRQLGSLGQPILVGLSRKATLGELTGRDVGERMPASIAAAVLAVVAGATIIRAHDVKETVDALRVTAAVTVRDGER
jgi:dihydropteroate synthase